MLRKVKHKKGTQFVKKDALNVIESLPSEFDKRDEHINSSTLLKEEDDYEDDEAPATPLISIKRVHPWLLSVENETSLLKLGDSISNWSEETEMEIVKTSSDVLPHNTNLSAALFNHILTSTSDVMLMKSEQNSIIKNAAIEQISSVVKPALFTDDIQVASNPIESIMSNNLINSDFRMFVPSDISVSPSATENLDVSSIISKAVLLQKNVNASNAAGIEVKSTSSTISSGIAFSCSGIPVQPCLYSLFPSPSPVPKISLINSQTLISASVQSVAGSFSVLKNLVVPAVSKDIDVLSVVSSPKVTTRPSVFNVNAISTSLSLNNPQQSVIDSKSLLNTTMSSSLLNVLHNFAPHFIQSKPVASVPIPASDKPVYISGPRLLSTLNNGNLSIQANQFLTVSPKVQLPVMNHSGLSQFKLPVSLPNNSSEISPKITISPTIVSSITTANKLPSIVSTATVINKQPIIINGENNIPLLKALVDAGINNQAGGIMAIKTSTGHFIIRTRNKGNYTLESGNITSTPSGMSITRMCSPSGVNILTSKQMGMTPVRPKSQVLAPQVASLTKFQTSVSLSPVQSIHPKISGSTVSLSSTSSADKNSNTPINVQRKILTKNTDTVKPSYNEDFYNKNHDRMKPLRVNFDKPELLLQHEIRRLQRRRRGIKSIFLLPKHLVKMLARRGGFIESPQFIYNSKTCTNWPECLPRPTFQVAWRYRLAEANHISTVSHLLRMLHCCFKWDIINNKPPKGVNRSITSNKGKLQIFVQL